MGVAAMVAELWNTIWVAPAFALVLLAVVLLGRRLAHREQQNTEQPRQWKIGPFEGSLLGMLALMFGFTFAGAAGNFREVQTNFDREAEALSETVRWGKQLPEADRTWFYARLLAYAQEVSHLEGSSRTRLRAFQETHAEMWDGLVARRAAAAEPRNYDACLNALNRCIQARHLGIYLDQRRLPVVVLLFILAASLLVGFLVGYSSELAGRHFFVLAVLFVLFVGSTVYTIWELDHPSEGLITANQDSLRQLPEWMKSRMK
jgi:hypothetical protein